MEKDEYISASLETLFRMDEWRDRARMYSSLTCLASLPYDGDRKNMTLDSLNRLRDELFPISKRLCDEANEKTGEAQIV